MIGTSRLILGTLTILMALTGFLPASGRKQAGLEAHSAQNIPVIRFAVIGDYGEASPAEQDVARLVKSWHPDFIITVGDNNYSHGEASTIDRNVGQYYRDFIYPYRGNYGNSSQMSSAGNRFFPVLGNHDWEAPNAQPFLDYFSLPGNERYYDFSRGPVHFFAVDSDIKEPDGITGNSRQAMWLKNRLASSGSRWKIVYLHHPPYSSGRHGSTAELQWPYQKWGATAVMAGHDHVYERIMRNGFPYFTNGLGGRSKSSFKEIVSGREIVSGSEVRFNGDYGAMLVEAGQDRITFSFYTRSGALVDIFTIN